MADAELEIVPREIVDHPSVRSSAKKRGRSPYTILLDSSLHHPALKVIADGQRRGRPDIVHVVLLLCLDSIVNREGLLETMIHTRNNDLLRIASQTRIPRNFGRFVGLMEDLFERGAVPTPEEPLITLTRDVTLEEVLKSTSGLKVGLSESGEPVELGQKFSRLKQDVTCVIGGFPHGGFLSPIDRLCDEMWSLHSTPLMAWTVASEILVAYGNQARKRREKG